MAATGFTPVYIYASGTTGNIPSAGNLTNTSNGSEIALNYFDGKLFFKNASNSVVTVPLLQSSSSQNGWLSSTDWSTFNSKQDALISGINIKTVNGTSLLGSGDLGTIGTGYGGTGTATTFTAGSIVYAGTSGVYNQDNANFFWDSTNHRLGIGTTSPAQALSITKLSSGATVDVLNLYNSASNVASSGVGIRLSGTSVSTRYCYIQAVIQAGTSNAHDLLFGTNTNGAAPLERMRIFASGGVSIGNTTDPGATNLSVTGSATIAGSATIQTVVVGLGNGANSSNTVVGNNSLGSIGTGNSGGALTAVGQYALSNNTTASYNSAFGNGALYTNTTGAENTACGYNALHLNSSSNDCSAFGFNALSASTGGSNTAVGAWSLGNTTSGAYNVSVGWNSLTTNTTSNNNTAIGSQSGYNLTSANNALLGYQAGYNITTGANNTCIGYVAGTDAVVNLTTQSNYVVIGNNATTNANIKVAWTVTSDARDKTNFDQIKHGLDFVTKLNPISYQFKQSRENETPVGKIRYGFKAQEILELEGDYPVIINNDDNENLKYNGESLVPVLVKAIQELTKKVKALEVLVNGH